MNRKSFKFILLVLTMVLSTVFAGIFSAYPVSAKSEEESLKFSKSKYTLYEGNTKSLNLIFNGEEQFQESFDFWNGGCFSSSDESVVSVDYSGYIQCQGTGKAVITAYYGDLTAKCTVKVKASKMDITVDEATLYSHQQVNVTSYGIKNVARTSCEIIPVDGWSHSWEDYPTVESDFNGNFTITAGRSGDYRIRLIVENSKGTTYSKNFSLYTVEAGPDRTDISIAMGGETEVAMMDSDIMSVELVKWYEGYSNYENYPENGDESACPIVSDGAGGFSGNGEATAIYNITYEVEDGSIVTTEVTVSCYDPGYIHFDKYLWVGSTYRPEFEYRRWTSNVTCSSSDTDIVDINGDEYFIPMQAGKAVLTTTIDGVVYKDEVEVLDVHIDGDSILTWTGTSFSFAVSGLSDDAKVEYSSSNTAVASISKKGKLKTKEKGFTKITVSVDNVKHSFGVNVGDEIPIKAALAAGEVVGKATYSQDRRMEEGYYDCSSLAWRSYAKTGLKIKEQDYAPTAADLAKYLEDTGCAISYEVLPVDQMMPGDLIFTSSGRDNGRFLFIDHVAMYYSTNCQDDNYIGWGENDDVYGTIVHAGSSGGGVYFSTYPLSNIVMIGRVKQ
ncbi:MAG: C40 family peptidase [Lachnospiraceae bacterium]|nr:C40 family peptidase [Lachnospiraceae bacterium]